MKLISIAGTFSLMDAQLVVGKLAGPGGSSVKGLAIGMHNRFNDYGIPMGEADAQALVDCLIKVEQKQLPAEFRMIFGLWNLSSLDLSFRKYDPKWFHGGGVKGSMNCTFFVLGFNLASIEVSMQEVSGLRACLQQFYGLKAG